MKKTLADVRARIARAGSRGLNEMDTRATLIEPVLAALGWDVHDVEEVAREYKRKRSDKPVDYALLLMREPKLFVEAKGLGGNLDDRKWANQIMGYAAVAGVEWIILTDGDEYRIYNAGATVRVEEKLLCTARISADDGQAEAFLHLLEKDQIGSDRLAAFWQADFVDRQVRGALEQLFDPEKDGTLIRHIRRVTKDLTPADIRRSLGRCQVSIDFPDASGLLTALASPDVAPKAAPAAQEAPRRRKAKDSPTKAPGRARGASEGVSVADLLRAGLLTAGTQLHVTYKRHQLKATVQADGTIEFGGTVYNSVSQAGAAARGSIIGPRPDGRLPATNGWEFWRCTGPDGGEVKVGELRRRQAKG